MSTSVPIPRLVLSGLSGGSGKTFTSLGLVRALTRRGLQVKPCKKGPDYIDAAWLGLAAGMAPTNLDLFFLPAPRLTTLFVHAVQNTDIAIIEGNRGLYDGYDLQGSCSTAALARALCAPVLLILTVTKMTRTTAAVIAGLASFEQIHLAGVLLNQVSSARHASLIRRSIEGHTDIPVIGELPRLRVNPIPERHMGLISMHDEGTASTAHTSVLHTLDNLARLIETHVDVDTALSIAQAAPPLTIPQFNQTETVHASSLTTTCTAAPPPVTIGYIRDAALWFYYEENLEALRQAGAKLMELSLFSPQPWPCTTLQGLYLGGGFPEMLAEKITASPHLKELYDLSLAGLPIYAECGGFIILCQELRIGEKTYPMAGIFPTRAEFRKRPQGLGYVKAKVERPNPFHALGSVFCGHEFHYSCCIPLAELDPTLSLSPGVGLASPIQQPTEDTVSDAQDISPEQAQWYTKLQGHDGLLIRRTFATYTHLFAPAVPHWATHFVTTCRD